VLIARSLCDLQTSCGSCAGGVIAGIPGPIAKPPLKVYPDLSSNVKFTAFSIT
jgi:hypothetical protein